MPKNAFSAHEPYPTTPPGNGKGVQKNLWTRSVHDVNSSQAGFMGIREMTRRHGTRNTAERSEVRTLLASVYGPRQAKTGAAMNPPYGIHSSKPRVRQAVKAWRKSVMKEQNAE